MLGKNQKLFFAISLLSILFYSFLISDITPFVRGPVDNILGSRWPYYFVNTFPRIWAPVLVIIIFLLLFNYFIFRTLSKKKEVLFLSSLVIIILLFQISLVFFSRFGLNILFRRMVDPGINGYFSTAVKFKNVNDYLKNYASLVPNFDQHGRGHPPGSVLLIKGVVFFFDQNKTVTDSINSKIPSPSKDATHLWKNLTKGERAASVVVPFLLHFLAALSIVPFYFLAKSLYGQKVGVLATFIYSIIPSLSFFALLFDPVYAVFPIFSFLSLIKYLKTKKNTYTFMSGGIFAAGLFFSASILPYLGIMGIYFFLSLKTKLKSIKPLVLWIFGFLILFYFPYLFKYDSFSSMQAVLKYQLPREYLPTLIFSPYEFFVFSGFPIALLFINMTFKKIKSKNPLLISFWATFIFLIVLGISRGEVGRIWLPLMSIPVLIVSRFLTEDLKFNKKYLAVLIFLLFTQVILMEEFWVPIW